MFSRFFSRVSAKQVVNSVGGAVATYGAGVMAVDTVKAGVLFAGGAAAGTGLLLPALLLVACAGMTFVCAAYAAKFFSDAVCEYKQTGGAPQAPVARARRATI